MFRRAAAVLGDDLAGAARSLLTKVLVSPLVAIAWLVAARLVIGTLGVDGYAAYAIIAGIALLLPFADLGTGAAVMDAMARRDLPDAEPLEKVLLTSFRILVLVAIALTGLGAAGSVAGVWSPLLGLPASAGVERGVALALCAFAVSLPLSLGSRLLIGGGLNHAAVLFQALSAVIMVALVAALTRITEAPEPYFAAPFVGMAIANGFALKLACQRLDIRLRPIVRSLAKKREGGATVRHIALPMLLISIILPLAYQSDRLILSHVTSLQIVAAYSVAFQIFSPLLGLVSSAGAALWPVFAKDRQEGVSSVSRQRLSRAQLAFAMLGLMLAVVLIVLGPPLASFVGGADVDVPDVLFISFACLVLIQSLLYPMAMLLTDSAGLRFQAKLHVGMLLLNIPLSVVLAYRMGAQGPVWGSVISIGVVLFLPELLRARRATGPRI